LSEKSKNLCMFPRSALKPQHVLKIGKTLSSTKGDLQVESSFGTSKEPTEVIDASSLDVT
jgi:hypothetical protein